MSRRILNYGIILVAFLVLGGLLFLSKSSKMKEKDISADDLVKDTPTQSKEMKKDNAQIQLPAPQKDSGVSVEKAIKERRSRRDFSSRPLSVSQLSQILWAAQGITDKNKGYRAAPSAGALYPLEIYTVVKEGGVEDLGMGVYHYSSENNSLKKLMSGNITSSLAGAALGQSCPGFVSHYCQV